MTCEFVYCPEYNPTCEEHCGAETSRAMEDVQCPYYMEKIV